jgi:hypothetical protein
MSLTLSREAARRYHIWHLVIRHPESDLFGRHVLTLRIDMGLHYPIPVRIQLALCAPWRLDYQFLSG